MDRLLNLKRDIKPLFVLAAKTLTPMDQIVRATANTATDSYAITLGNVAECRGQFVAIVATIANSKAITVQDQNESEDWTDLTLDADRDACVLWSDGRRWWIFNNSIAS